MKVERTLPNLLFSLTLAKNNTIQKAKAIKTNAPISSVTPEAAHLEPCCIDQPLNVFWLSSFDTFETCPLFMVPKNVLSVSQREQKSKRMSAYVFEMKHGYTDSLSNILSQKKWGSVLGPLINSDTKHTHTYTHTQWYYTAFMNLINWTAQPQSTMGTKATLTSESLQSKHSPSQIWVCKHLTEFS